MQKTTRALRFAVPALALCLLAPHAAHADPVSDMLRALPASVQAVSRVPGPENKDVTFFIVREDKRDRLFLAKGGDSLVEIAEAAETGGRVSGLRSEMDDLGLAAFVDFRDGNGEETTFELFLEGDDPEAYIFRPASN
ncbi:hypothetical protein [Stappia sp.]|jgi:hypothetical protein|uniref:hypothetical protein n=1 Tax=Stappia sp. TaxID=1870903 RepID=UPI003A9A5535